MRKVGDKNKEPALVHVSLRVPEWVYKHYLKVGKGSYTDPMREALERCAGRFTK